MTNDALQKLTWPSEELARRLLAKGLVTEDSLVKALGLCEGQNLTLAEALAGLNTASKRAVYEEFAAVYGVPFVDLRTYAWDPLVLALVDEKMARELELFPLFTIGQTLTVALAFPGDVTAIDRVTSLSEHPVEVCLAARDDIRDAINRAYGSSTKVKKFLEEMSESSVPATSRIRAQQSAIQNDDSPVSQLVDLIIKQAVRDRASDIHIDPDEESLNVRFRIDGVLYEIPPPPKYLHPFVVSRIKVVSNMDIAESRAPQEGHFRTLVDGRTVEARVSSMPTIHGQNVVIRLLDSQTMSIALEHLGVPEDLLPQVDLLARRPHGMMVVTGPTGSGKSTTLYAMLMKARSPERHVVTIEDPVECRLKWVTQIQVNEKVNVTFAAALRNILRQDPDIIMVGEIRDVETAQLAIRAALTGHLIFSTIHTNDAPGVVTRLVNMGIEPYLVSSALICGLAQRLVRRICEDCREPWRIPEPLRNRLTAAGLTVPKTLWRGKGCANCRNTGYRGRTGIFELMTVTPDMADLICAGAPAGPLSAQARKDGMRGMVEDGIAKAGEGITTLQEILRIAELEPAVEPESRPSEARVEPVERPAAEPAVPGKASLDLADYQKRMENWLGGKPRPGTIEAQFGG